MRISVYSLSDEQLAAMAEQFPNGSDAERGTIEWETWAVNAYTVWFGITAWDDPWNVDGQAS